MDYIEHPKDVATRKKFIKFVEGETNTCESLDKSKKRPQKYNPN